MTVEKETNLKRLLTKWPGKKNKSEEIKCKYSDFM